MRAIHYRPTTVDTKDADSFINQQNQIGVSGGINQINPNRWITSFILTRCTKII
jgi:hypothetical protein